LFDVGKSGCTVLSRTETAFRDLEGRNPRPLETIRVSRRPITIRVEEDGRVSLEAATELDVFVDGVHVPNASTFPATALISGISLKLSSFVLLQLGIFEVGHEPLAIPELVGHSPRMRELRAEIGRLADLDVPVLLRGETGVGKELVAAALHHSSKRREGPYVRVNMAAIPPLMAAGELFGHASGAFTGATSARDGYFVDADRGSLFLDEIGEATIDVQSVLLRTIETGEIQPLGGTLRTVSVRLITATDSDLDADVERGAFSRALLQRFGYELWVPALREHKEDIPLLFGDFLGEELRAFGEEARLCTAPEADQHPYLTADFIMSLLRHDWPGNVRELRGAARRYAIHNRGREHPEVDERLRTMLIPGAPASGVLAASDPNAESQPAEAGAREANPAPRREAVQLKDQDVLEALRRYHFEIDRTARELGVSRSWMHARMNAIAGVRKAKDLRSEEIQNALRQNDGDIERAARQLEVSAKGLQLQITRLGLRNGVL
jgi:two-component system nitrogen regulation response regulator GlnG